MLWKSSEKSELIQEKRKALTYNIDMIMKEIVDVESLFNIVSISRYVVSFSRYFRIVSTGQRGFTLILEDVLKELDFGAMNDLLLELIQSLREDEETSMGLWYDSIRTWAQVIF